MFFYLFTVRQSSSVWALLISLNSKEYLLTGSQSVAPRPTAGALPGNLSETLAVGQESVAQENFPPGNSDAC